MTRIKFHTQDPEIFRRHRTECSGHGVAPGFRARLTKCTFGYYEVRLEVGAVRRGLYLAD